MDELRETLAKEIHDALLIGCTEKPDFHYRLADLILTIPAIKEAVEYRQKRTGWPEMVDAIQNFRAGLSLSCSGMPTAPYNPLAPSAGPGPKL